MLFGVLSCCRPREGSDAHMRRLVFMSAICQCWASICSPRAVAYRVALEDKTLSETRQYRVFHGEPSGGRHGGPSVVGMAVVVQLMIAADVSGVLFTANPVTLSFFLNYDI